MQKDIDKNIIKGVSKNKGYSLIELMIVIIIIATVMSGIMYSLKGAFFNMNADAVIGEVALSMYTARESALTGVTDLNKRTFHLQDVINKNYNGIKISSTSPISSNNNCKSDCIGETSNLCVSGESFCFTPGDNFVFERFSGRLNNARIIFVSNEKRNLALLATTNGNFFVAELINGKWKTERELKGMRPTTQSTQNQQK